VHDLKLFSMDKSLTGESQNSLLTQTKRLLRQFDLRARKGLGQHFLIDREVLNLITQAAELVPTDVIIEVGPGLGILTGELAKKAGRVIAVELDDKLAAVLKQTLASFNNVTIINDDVLKFEPGDWLKERKARYSYKVVANLPYYITAPVLRHFLEASAKPQMMIVMVQREVGEAITAKPGEMSLLSVSVQFYGEPRIIGGVPARCFYPSPKVDSAILRVDRRPKSPVADEAGFFNLVRAGFTAPRKQIVNSLTQGLGMPKTDVLSLLEAAGIMPNRRAETLTLEDWTQLLRMAEGKKDVNCTGSGQD
jgi:16S rRNA (adenine1518-N6/adenine1519-N6)-dimethyltransferase